MARHCIATNGTPACFGKGIELNLSALSPVVELYLPHEHAHTVDLRNDDRCLCGDKLTPRNHVNDTLTKFCLATRAQSCDGDSLRARGDRQAGVEHAWRAE